MLCGVCLRAMCCWCCCFCGIVVGWVAVVVTCCGFDGLTLWFLDWCWIMVLIVLFSFVCSYMCLFVLFDSRLWVCVDVAFRLLGF